MLILQSVLLHTVTKITIVTKGKWIYKFSLLFIAIIVLKLKKCHKNFNKH